MQKGALTFLTLCLFPFLICAEEKKEGLLSLSGPSDRQIVQRGDNNKGMVEVAGTAGAEALCVEATWFQGEAPDPNKLWAVVSTSFSEGKFSGPVEVPAGGWYRLAVRVVDRRGAVLQQVVVDHVGVGEVFVIAGQSNSANYGETPQKPKDDRVLAFDGKGWHVANDPQPLADGNGGSPWPVLGDLLVQALNVPVGFASVGVGGTDSEQWLPLPPAKLYSRIEAVLKKLGPHGCRALLWHQGETDAEKGTPAETYFKRIAKLIEVSRKDAGFELPWVVAHAAFLPSAEKSRQEAIRAGQARLWEKKLALKGPDTDDLQGDFRMADHVHFSVKGLQEHAKRWFDVLQENFFKKNPSDEKSSPKN